MKNFRQDKGKNSIHIQFYQITINLISATKEYKELFGKKLYENCEYSISHWKHNKFIILFFK